MGNKLSAAPASKGREIDKAGATVEALQAALENEAKRRRVLENKLKNRDEDKKIESVALALLAFKFANCSTSTSLHSSVVSSKYPIRSVSAAVLVKDCCQMDVFQPITPAAYTRITAAIKTNNNPDAGEVKGIQPRHHEELRACLTSVSARQPDRQLFRSKDVPEIPRPRVSPKLMRIPDNFVGYGRDVYLVLLPDEVKLPGDLKKGKEHYLSIQ